VIDLDGLLKFVQYCSIIIAGVFGILALFVDYKDEATKKITFWGKFAVSGVLFSTLLGAISLTLETSIQKQAEEERFQRYQNTLQWFQRISTPLAIRRINAIFKATRNSFDNVEFMYFNVDDIDTDLFIKLEEIVERTLINFSLTKADSALLKFDNIFGTYFIPNKDPYTYIIRFSSPIEKSFIRFGIRCNTDDTIQKLTANYLSLLDLPTSRIVVELETQIDYTTLDLQTIFDLFMLDYLDLKIGEIVIRIPASKFVFKEETLNYHKYEYIFPSTVDKLLELTSF